MIHLWEMHSHQYLATLRADRSYERLDISGTLGLTNAQQAALRALALWARSMQRPQCFDSTVLHLIQQV